MRAWVGSMVLSRSAGCAALLFVLAGCASVGPSGGQSPEISPDQALAALLEEQRGRPNGSGLVIIGAAGGQGSGCSAPEMSIGQIADGKFIGRIDETFPRRMFGSLRFRPAPFRAGEYLVGSVKCGNRRYNGPHAKFQVRAGEIVDVGTLQVDFSVSDLGDILLNRGNLKRTVGPTDPKRLEAMRESTPLLMRKLVKRPMTIIGEADVRMRPRGLF